MTTRNTGVRRLNSIVRKHKQVKARKRRLDPAPARVSIGQRIGMSEVGVQDAAPTSP